MRIEEIMTASPVTVRETTTVGQAWDALRSLDIRHLPVVNADGELVGIVSDRDFTTPPGPPLMAELLGTGAGSLAAPVGAIPVVDAEGAVVGIVSYLDIIRAMRGRPALAEASP
jgi:CBS domain-containing protein